MKARSFRYLLFEGLKNIWVNRLMSVASIGVLIACMLLMGLAVAFSMNVDKLMGTVEQQNVVMVYLNDSLNDEEISALQDKINQMENVQKTVYIPKSVGLESMTEGLDEEAQLIFREFENEEENPLPNAIQVTYRDLSLFDETTQQLNQLKEDGSVSEIRNQREIAMQINNIRNVVSIGGVWLIALLMVIALVIISNTVRITMFSRKLEISIMKAVGATDGFIRFPFMVEGMCLGIIAAGITTGIVYLVYNFAIDQLSQSLDFSFLSYGSFVWILLGLFVMLGVLAGLLGSLVSIRKYLKREGSEFSGI